MSPATGWRPDAETIDRILYCGSRAPSPHNAQGFVLSWERERIAVRLDAARQVLRELDPTAREGELACGAALHNVCLAAAALGLRAEVALRPRAGDRTLLAEVALAPGGEVDEALLAGLSRRAVNRSPYQAGPLEAAALEALAAEAREAGFSLTILTARPQLEEVAGLVTRAGTLKLAHRQTAAELQHLLRTHGSAAAAARDGLDLELFQLPPGGAAASGALMRPSLLGAVPGLAAAMAHAAEGAPIAASPAVCLLHAPADHRDAFLRGGGAFQRVALRAASLGLALQPHSAAIEVSLALPGPLDASLPEHEVQAIDLGLRRAFGLEAAARPLVLFRLGKPTRTDARRSLRRPQRAALPAESAHYRELTRRNQPAVAAGEQAALRGLRVLFAGCGSIGGAPVEVLARMGLARFLLAEPGSYELNNLNRQAALLPDVGRNKAAALRDRVFAINPEAEVLVEPQGVTAGNADWLVGSCDVVIDGVDVTDAPGIAAKRLLHEEAFRQRRLVISGLDLGGTQLVKVFDYRDPSVKLFDGRLDGAGELPAVEFLSRLIEPTDLPPEMLGYTEALIRGEGGSPPQLGPTAVLFGVLAAWAVLDFACGRPLQRRLRLDLPALWRPWPQRLAARATHLLRLLRLKLLFEVTRARAN